MPIISWVLAVFSFPGDKPELLLAQAKAFSRQIPLLYFILLANAAALSYTHFGSAPAYLTIYIPSALAVVCIIRVVFWWRSRRKGLTVKQAKRLLMGTTPLAAVLGIGFVSWSFALFPHGDAYQQAHVFFYMAITVIGCIFCLMHLRSAAFLLAGVVVVPMTIFFGSSGQPVFMAITINIVLVTIAMIAILTRRYQEFTDLIAAKKALMEKNAQSRRLSDENYRLANLDSLTALPNRRRFLEELDARLAQVQSGAGNFLVGMIDLDGFKPVNDAFGHAVGDKLLVQVAGRVTQFQEGRLFVARLGGDEFGLIVDEDLGDTEIERLGAQLCQALCEPYVLPDVIAPVAGSIGFCRYPDGGTTAEELFERADYALYHAKRTRRGSAMLFSDQHSDEIKALNRVENALREADLEVELRPVFQPIVDMEIGRTIGFESLARWDSTTLGPVPPAVFIAAAERLGIVSNVTEVLARKVLRIVNSWPMDMRVSFNLSAKDIASPETVDRVISIVRASCVQPHRIDFEITETALVNDFIQAKRALHAIRELGAKTSLDDFGTGYSSLSHVRQLPLDKLKIDRSFVSDIEADQASRDIVKAVLDLCRNLRFECVIEGVETQGQVEMVRQLGGLVMQGYLFAKPMRPEEIGDYLTAERLKSRGEPSCPVAADGGVRKAV